MLTKKQITLYLGRKKINRYIIGAVEFIMQKYTTEPLKEVEIPKVRFQKKLTATDEPEVPSRTERIQFSIGPAYSKEDLYNEVAVNHILKGHSDFPDPTLLLKKLELNTDQTFVDRLLVLIKARGWKDSTVYKAAQIDKRLFSKMISNRHYRPSKDTAIALSFGLQLSLESTRDLLARAGYVLSHSDKRDIVIEYFVRNNITNLVYINEVLYHLDMKTIGRS